MDNKVEAEIRKRETAEEYTQKKRGEVIDSAIEIENTLTDIITWCFYPSKYSRYETIKDLIDSDGLVLKSMLLRRIDFRDKIEMLRDVISLKKPEIIKSNAALINTIEKELDKVRKFRNLLAHSESDLSREFINDSVNYDNSEPINKIQIIEYKKGKAVKHVIDRARYVSESMTMHRVSIRLWQLFALLNDDYEFSSEFETWLKNDL